MRILNRFRAIYRAIQKSLDQILPEERSVGKFKQVMFNAGICDIGTVETTRLQRLLQAFEAYVLQFADSVFFLEVRHGVVSDDDVAQCIEVFEPIHTIRATVTLDSTHKDVAGHYAFVRFGDDILVFGVQVNKANSRTLVSAGSWVDENNAISGMINPVISGVIGIDGWTEMFEYILDDVLTSPALQILTEQVRLVTSQKKKLPVAKEDFWSEFYRRVDQLERSKG